MAENANCTVYIGNLDERVSDRVLYDILIQAGRVVDLYIPKDRETEKRKGFAFAQYESEEVAEYAVKLFSGLVTIYNRTLKFAISGKDKPSGNSSVSNTPVSSSFKIRPQPVQYDDVLEPSSFKARPEPVQFDDDMDLSPPPKERLSTSFRFSEQQTSRERVPVPSDERPNGYSPYHESTKYDHSRSFFEKPLDSIGPSRWEDSYDKSSYSYHSRFY